MRKFIVFAAAAALLYPASSAFADRPVMPSCASPTITVVVQEAYTETIEHEAEVEVIEHSAVTEEREIVVSPAIWANWAPSDTKGPQDYEPIWPTDERGKWIVHDKVPGGHEGPDGVYQQGGGNSPWFYRQAEVTETETVVIEEAWTEEKVIKDAWTEVINHEAVTEKQPNPDYPCQEPKPEPKPEPLVKKTPDPDLSPEPVKQPVAVPTAVDAGL